MATLQFRDGIERFLLSVLPQLGQSGVCWIWVCTITVVDSLEVFLELLGFVDGWFCRHFTACAGVCMPGKLKNIYITVIDGSFFSH